MYLDAGSSGQRFDYDSEVALGYNAGFGPGPIDLNTGMERLKLAVDWAKPRGIRLALTETGMPIDDPRWEDMFSRLLNYARDNGVEVQSWNGGSHWTLHNNAINIVPDWHQDKTMDPQVAGVMKASAGVAKATIHDDGPGWAPSGTPITVTVYARGYLAAPVTLTITSSNGGTLSKTQVTIPAGANRQDTFTFTPGSNRVTTLTYTASGGATPPPPRKVYSLTDPVAYAATSLPMRPWPSSRSTARASGSWPTATPTTCRAARLRPASRCAPSPIPATAPAPATRWRCSTPSTPTAPPWAA